MTTMIELPFGDGVYRFHLTTFEMAMLEQGYDDGGGRRPPIIIGNAYARLLKGRYELDGKSVGLPTEAAFSTTEMAAIVRAALLGGKGGVVNGEEVVCERPGGLVRHVTQRNDTRPRRDVDSLMVRYFDDRPLIEQWDLCLAIMGARVEGLTPAKPDTADA